MELFKQHMVDDIEFEKFVKLDRENKRIFEPMRLVKARVVYQHTIIKLENEEEVISRHTIYTQEPIGELDRVNGMDVLSIREYKTLLGKEVWGYEIRV